MLGRVQRDGHAAQVADLLGPLPGAVDDDLRLDLAGAGGDPGHGAAAHGDAGHGRVLADDRAALARAAGQRLGQVGRVGPAVARQPQRAHQVIGGHDRVQLGGPLRADQLAVDLVGGRGGRGPRQRGHPLGGPGHGDAAAPAEARGLAGLRLQPLVQPGRVLHQPGAGLRCAQLADQAGRVPGGAAGQLPLLQQQHVGLAQLGQVVGDAGADHPAPDDDDAGAGWQRRGFMKFWNLSPLPGRRRAAGRRPGWSGRPRPPRTAPCPTTRSRSRAGCSRAAGRPTASTRTARPA